MRNRTGCQSSKTFRKCLIYCLSLMAGAGTCAGAEPAPAAQCPNDKVAEHVREQFAQFGPLSTNREYFGFIYRLDGEIASAVARGNVCKNADRCTTDTALAAASIPKGAKVLGEWHTHPLKSGSQSLSIDDLHGAHHNRAIRCYTAYYSTPKGDIYAWDPNQTSVPVAMGARAHVGNFWQPQPAAADASQFAQLEPEVSSRLREAPTPL